RRWAIFSMREDYVAGLDPYLHALPTRLASTFRLNLLDRAAALPAMVEPCREAGVTFRTEAANKLIDDLRLTRVQGPGGPVQLRGPFLEPVQLQVVCWSLWQQLQPQPGGAIRLDDLARFGDVDDALGRYYDEQLRAALAVSPGTSERTVRTWFDRQLITV